MKKALIVTDMQKGFMNEKTISLIPKIKKLLKQKLFNYTIFTQFINLPDSQYEKLISFVKLKGPPETSVVDKLKPFVKILFPKNTYSPFTPAFETFLQKNEIKELYFVGVDTNACVFKGAVDAFEKGYLPFVLSYYCASHSGVTFHRFSLKNLEKMIGKKQVIKKEINKV